MICATRARGERPSDSKRKRVTLRIGSLCYHLTQEEALKLGKRLLRLCAPTKEAKPARCGRLRDYENEEVPR